MRDPVAGFRGRAGAEEEPALLQRRVSQSHGEGLREIVHRSDLDHVAQRFGDGEARTLRFKMETYVRGGNAIDDGRRLLLTREGKLLADGISADLFF